MIKECPCLDYCIPLEDCVGCETPCDNPAMYSKLEKEHIKKVEEKIRNIYFKMFKNDCYINLELAYNKIIKKLEEA
jgi:hypothetical protein